MCYRRIVRSADQMLMVVMAMTVIFGKTLRRLRQSAPPRRKHRARAPSQAAVPVLHTSHERIPTFRGMHLLFPRALAVNTCGKIRGPYSNVFRMNLCVSLRSLAVAARRTSPVQA